MRVIGIDLAVSVGLIDIDRFKRINDSLGHPAGDEVLVELGRRWRRTLRRYDKLGRYGGEEFLVVAPGCSGNSSPWERLREAAASKPVATSEGPLEVTVSIGTAECRGDVASDRLIAAADEALYRAKEAGRNRVEHGDSPLEGNRGRARGSAASADDGRRGRSGPDPDGDG